jgi:hypothetical protein
MKKREAQARLDTENGKLKGETLRYLRPKRVRRAIRQLKDEKGVVQTEDLIISKVAKNFYKELYKKREVDEEI